MFEELLSKQNDHERRIRRQEAKSVGPTLGEFYGQWLGGPGLRGLWYPGVAGETGSMPDRSGSARTLSYVGTQTIKLYNDLVPYWDYPGVGSRHFRNDEAGLEIAGNGEGYIDSELAGLTIGGWFWADALTSDDIVMCKDDVGASRAYLLSGRETNSQARFGVSNNGTAVTEVGGATGSFATGEWRFLVGRFVPSTQVGIFSNGDWVLNTTSIPATIYTAGTAAFTIAARSGGAGNLFDGRFAVGFLAAAAWPDALIDYLWQRSRTIFGV